MLGKPVTREHGGPVRLYVAPMYGYKSLKWLERIEVVERPRRSHRPRLLGAARLRRRRLGRALQRPRRRRADVTAGGRRPARRRSGRALHRAPSAGCTGRNATLFLVLLATGMTLYIPSLSTLVGRRVLVKDIHVYSGLLLPVPLLARLRRPLAGRACAATSAASPGGRPTTGAGCAAWAGAARSGMGKFNAGQKLNAIFVAGCIPLMLATGGIMRWFDPFPLAWRTGATFVHDWLALTLLVVVIGHIGKALAEPVSPCGRWPAAPCPPAHAERHHPRWWAEVQDGPIVPRCRPDP